ncbi:MAG: META domain-containing protein, partial [Candidatus Limnocylindrales bacterium]
HRPLAAIITAVLVLVLALAPAAAIAQEVSPEPSPAPAESTPAVATSPMGAWLVTAFDAWQTGLTEPLPESVLRLSFLADGRLQGETACGRFNGGWSGEGRELFAGVAPTGFLGCADAQTGEAIGLSTALEAVVGWQADELGGLALLDASGATRLLLEPLQVGDPTGEWLVTRYRRANGEWAEPVPDRPMELRLQPDGLLEGSTGCRLLLGEYRFDAGDITIGPFDVEGLPCEGDVGRAERRLLRALGTVTTWEQGGDSLTLSDETQPVVELVRALEDAG